MAPGHVLYDKGQRQVFMNDGYRAKLTPYGLCIKIDEIVGYSRVVANSIEIPIN